MYLIRGKVGWAFQDKTLSEKTCCKIALPVKGVVVVLKTLN